MASVLGSHWKLISSEPLKKLLRGLSSRAKSRNRPIEQLTEIIIGDSVEATLWHEDFKPVE
jgi:hypothetical protein